MVTCPMRFLIVVVAMVTVLNPGTQVQGSLLNPCTTPASYPSSIPLATETYVNWAQELVVPHVLTAVPRNVDDVLALVNWATTSGYKIRAVGFSHTWAPTTITAGTTPCPKVLLVYTLPYLNNITLVSKEDDPATGLIRAQSGASLLALLSFAQSHGLGFHNHPASGDHTVGGILAIGGHGAGLVPTGTTLEPGFALGSVSNLLHSVTAVVGQENGSYALQTFVRDVDDDAPAFFTHLGRIFVTEVTLHAGPLVNLRCQSYTDVPASELFANPAAAMATATQSGKTIQNLVNTSAAFEIILFSFTDTPWLKVWTNRPTRPLTSRPTLTPFNYPFSYTIPTAASAIIDQINANVPGAGRLLGPVMFNACDLGLTATLSRDLWGPAKNVLLFVLPTTVRTTNAGFSILTRRRDVQLVSYTVYNKYMELLNEYETRGEYPINIGFELRVGGVDNAAEVGETGNQLPWLSSASPLTTSHPEFDVTIWVEVLTLPSTPGHTNFCRELEQFLLAEYGFDSDVGVARPEWSKGWAYTEDAGWADAAVFQNVYPTLYDAAGDGDAGTKMGMQRAREVYAKYDPANLYNNEFLDLFL